MKKSFSALLFTSFVLLTLLLVSCATAPTPGSPSRQGWNQPEAWESSSGYGPLPAASPAYVPAPEAERPGLGTGWGEDRDSAIRYTSFSRGKSAKPWGSGRLFYNDSDGAQAMARKSGFAWQSSGPVNVANGTLAVGLQDARGRWLKSFSDGGDRFYVGDSGDRYQISIENRTNSRIEVVVSVDGLDVMDGKSAAQSKRGYILSPGAKIKVEGFRQSDSQVAAFRFSSVADSYSSKKHGTTRNVGVIGIAVFTENGQDPRHSEDTALRHSADPFPSSRYATAP